MFCAAQLSITTLYLQIEHVDEATLVHFLLHTDKPTQLAVAY